MTGTDRGTSVREEVIDRYGTQRFSYRKSGYVYEASYNIGRLTEIIFCLGQDFHHYGEYQVSQDEIFGITCSNTCDYLGISDPI